MYGLFHILFATQFGIAIPAPQSADIAWVASGNFCEPETVLPLPDDTLLVSSVCDFRTTGTGFLTLLGADGHVINWRVVDNLDAPLGMALLDDWLYVIDNNQVKIFRWPDYELKLSIALDTAVANDVAVAADHTIYVSDTARGNVVVVGSDLQQSLLQGTESFMGANGMHINGEDLYVGGTRLWHVDLRDSTVTTLGPEWLADIDGIEMESDGTLQITPVGGPLVRMGAEMEVIGGEGVSSANHGYAENLGLALIPTGFDNTVIAIRLTTRK